MSSHFVRGMVAVSCWTGVFFGVAWAADGKGPIAKGKPAMGSTGQTVLEAARAAGEALGKVPASAKSVAAQLKSAIDAAAHTIAAAVQATATKLEADGAKALHEVRASFSLERLLAKSKDKTKTKEKTKGPKAKGAKPKSKGLVGKVSKAMKGAARAGQEAVALAAKAAEGIVVKAKADLASALAAAQKLGAAGASISKVAETFFVAAKRQAGRLVVAAKRRARKLVRMSVVAGRVALEAAAGKKKGISKRVVRLWQAFDSALKAADGALGKGDGAGKKAAAEIRRVAEAARDEVVGGRKLVAGAALEAVRGLSKVLNARALKSASKDKATRAKRLGAIAKQAIAGAMAVGQKMLRVVRALVEKSTKDADRVVVLAKASAKSFGAQGAALTEAALAFARAVRKEAARALLRGRQAAKGALKQAASVTKTLIGKAAGSIVKIKGYKGLKAEATLAGIDPALRGDAQKVLSDFKQLNKESSAAVLRAKRDLKAAGRKTAAEVRAKVGAATKWMKDVGRSAQALRQLSFKTLQGGGEAIQLLLRRATQEAQRLATKAETLAKAALAKFGQGPAAKSAVAMVDNQLDLARRRAARFIRSARSAARKAVRAAADEAEDTIDKLTGVKRKMSAVRRATKELKQAVDDAPKTVRSVGKRMVLAFKARYDEFRAKVYGAISAAAAIELKVGTAARARLAQLVDHVQGAGAGARKGAATAAPRALTAAQMSGAVGDLVKMAKGEAEKLVSSVRDNSIRVVAAMEKDQAALATELAVAGAGSGEKADDKSKKKDKSKKDKKDKKKSKKKKGKGVSPADAAKTVQAAAASLAGSFKSRAARALLLAQTRARGLVRAVLTASRGVFAPVVAKVGLGSMGSAIKVRLRAFELLVGEAPAAVAAIGTRLLTAQRKVTDDSKTAVTAVYAAMAKAATFAQAHAKHLAAAAKQSPAAVKAMVKRVLDGVRGYVRQAMEGAKKQAAGLVADAEKATATALAGFAKSKEPAARKATEQAKALLLAAREDAARLLMTARARAKEVVRRTMEDARLHAPAPARGPSQRATAPGRTKA